MSRMDLAKVLLLVVGGFLLIWPRGRRWVKWPLGLLALLSVWSYTYFGELHQYGAWGRHFYHYHEIYHYYVGAKYYRELGNTRLYDCTVLGFTELGQAGVRVPRIDTVRDLSSHLTAHPLAWVLANRGPECRARFSDARWAQFKADLATFLSAGSQDEWWRVAMYDLGFNPPPSWNVLGSTLANLIPLTHLTMDVLPFIDMYLLILAAPLMIAWAFGFIPACGYLIVLGNNFLASWSWTGGSYFRQVEFFCLVAGLAGLRMRRFVGAGAFLGVGVALRIFPAFFATGAFLALALAAHRDPVERRSLTDFTRGFASTLGILVLASLGMYGLNHWRDFFLKIIEHNATHFVMHIGFRKWAVFSESIGGQSFWWEQGLVNFKNWEAMLAANYDRARILYQMLRLGGTVLSIAAALRRKPEEAALIVGSAFFFYWSMPANYYYVYLAAWVPVFWRQWTEGWGDVRMFLLFAMLAGLMAAPLLSRDNIIYNGYLNRMVYAFVVLIPLSYLLEDRRVRLRAFLPTS
jgi:hypothetical protein